jgi:hypothetical protein
MGSGDPGLPCLLAPPLRSERSAVRIGPGASCELPALERIPSARLSPKAGIPPGATAAPSSRLGQVSYQGDAKKLRRDLERKGWRVEKRQEYWLLFPPDGSTAPARMPGTPSSQRTWSNLLADLKRKGYKQ